MNTLFLICLQAHVGTTMHTVHLMTLTCAHLTLTKQRNRCFLCVFNGVHTFLLPGILYLSGTRVAKTDGFSRSCGFKLYKEKKNKLCLQVVAFVIFFVSGTDISEHNGPSQTLLEMGAV